MTTVIADNVTFNAENGKIEYVELSRAEFVERMIKNRFADNEDLAGNAYDFLIGGGDLQNLDMLVHFGVEAVSTENSLECENESSEKHYILSSFDRFYVDYLNSGDTYSMTLADYRTRLSDNRVIAVTCWGDVQDILCQYIRACCDTIDEDEDF